jgi:multidrug efflux pump subunit AcrA (membrane-fusion protein)
MHRDILATIWHRPARRYQRPLAILALVTLATFTGCGKEKKATKAATEPPTVQVIEPTKRTIVRTVGQPSFIDAYEQTPIYPKLTGYIEKWIVDIGDKVTQGQVLATLFVPELRQSYQTKKADVAVAKARISLANKMVKVAAAEVKGARARLAEAKSILARYKAAVERWESQVDRLQREVDRGVVDPQVLLESRKQFKADTATYESQEATVLAKEADLQAREAELEKATVDVEVANADLAVAESEEQRLKVWVDYLTLTAPFPGIIVARNANTGDFVLPSTGDPSADRYAPDVSPAKAAPIYVVARTDVVRIFVDVPEQDANFVQIGSKATVLARAFKDQLIPAQVTRTSWALNVKSRTLRAEIDIKNPESKLLPGMYAYAKVIIERPGVRALPVRALTESGDQTYCWRYVDGRAIKTDVQTGVSDGEWIEVTNLMIPASKSGPTPDDWKPFDGSEKIIMAQDLSVLTDNEPVKIGKPTPETPDTGKNEDAERKKIKDLGVVPSKS